MFEENERLPDGYCGVSTVCDISSPEQESFLPTAVVQLAHDNSRMTGRIGFDSFSQLTFVRKAVVEQLGLPMSKPKRIVIKGFGAQTTVKSCCKTELTLCPRNGTPPIKVEALVCDGQICETLSGVPIDVSQYPHLANVPLEDSFPREPVELDVLIGSSLFWHFIEGPISQPQDKNDPFAVKTVFGNLLWGSYPVNTFPENWGPARSKRKSMYDVKQVSQVDRKQRESRTRKKK